MGSCGVAVLIYIAMPCLQSVASKSVAPGTCFACSSRLLNLRVTAESDAAACGVRVRAVPPRVRRVARVACGVHGGGACGVARRALLHDGHGPQHAVGGGERHHRPHEPARPRRVDTEEIHSPLDDGRRVKPTKGVAPGQTVVDRAGEPGQRNVIIAARQHGVVRGQQLEPVGVRRAGAVRGRQLFSYVSCVGDEHDRPQDVQLPQLRVLV